jgi:hypothetical protein
VKQQASVAQDLELLADFIADVAIIRMEVFQFAGEGAGGALVCVNTQDPFSFKMRKYYKTRNRPVSDARCALSL